jgi:hypothetical protein
VADLAWDLWDRALDENFKPRRNGDRALRNALRFHNLVRSGGLAYAIDTDYESAALAAAGLRLLGALETAQIIAQAQGIAGRLGRTSDEVDILKLTDGEADELERLNDRYSERLPTDDDLLAVLRRYLKSNPEAFEPLGREGAHQ